jgi:hypothetical protein
METFAIAKFDAGYRIIISGCNASYNPRVGCIDEKGAAKWTFDPGSPGSLVSHPTIANIDTVGDAEILVTCKGNGTLFCLDPNGSVLWSTAIGATAVTPVVSNLDGVGYPEIIVACGSTVRYLDHQGNFLYSYVSAEAPVSGFAVADVDLDGSPEVLYPGYRGTLFCLTSTAQLKWSCDLGDQTNVLALSVPAVADIDNDNFPEIVIFSRLRTAIYALRDTGSGVDTVWKATAMDGTAISRPCPVICDIDGDNDKDVIWIGTEYLGIYNGLDGKHPDNSGNPYYKHWGFKGDTGDEHGASVADIDNDNHVEIVGIYGKSAVGVLQYDAGWATSRKIFQDYMYHITEVNDDMTVPHIEPQHWKTHNTWLTQLPYVPSAVEEKDHKLNLFDAFPVPFAKNVRIRTEEGAILDIFSVDGRLVYSVRTGNQETVWGNDAAPGIYFCHARMGNTTKTAKLLKIGR